MFEEYYKYIRKEHEVKSVEDISVNALKIDPLPPHNFDPFPQVNIDPVAHFNFDPLDGYHLL